jgi:hypothetical protein
VVRGKRSEQAICNIEKSSLLMRIFYVNFQPKLQFLAFFITGKHLNNFTCLQRVLGFWFFQQQISLIFNLHYRQSFRNTCSQTSIYPVPKAKLPINFVLFLDFSPDICVTILFMVFCCCSTDIILNRFPLGEMIVFPSQLRSYQSAKRLLTSKGGSLCLDQFASRQNYSELVRVSP